MLKKTLVIALATLLAGNAHAKVTFEIAAEQDAAARAYNNSVNKGAPIGGLDDIALEESSGGDAWKSHWTGRTTGSVSVPRNAKEVFVKYQKGVRNHSNGYDIVPVNAGSLIIASDSASWTSSSQNHDRHCSASASAKYSNYTVSGGQEYTGVHCNVAVYITSVMYR